MTLDELKKLSLDKQEELFKKIDSIRSIAKNVNYGSQYGAGAAKLAKTGGIPLKQAKELHGAYWSKNWAIKAFASKQYIKEVDGEMWVYNPVSGFYYSLRYEKDIFSTVVQSTGVFCFDTWISRVLKRREQITAQFHDEGVWVIPKGREKDMEVILREAIDETNQILGLNRELGIDIKFGKNYSEVH